MTFREILRKEMEKTQSEDPTLSMSSETAYDYQVSYVEFNIAPKLFRSKQIPYPSKQIRGRSETKHQRPRPIRPEPVVLLSDLNAIELASLETLKRQLPEWQPNECLSASSLKKAYRKLARTHHPDLNPEASPRLFQSVQQANDILMRRLKRATKPATDAPKAA